MNIFMAESPLQIVAAYEARYYFASCDSVLFVILARDKGNVHNVQMKRTAELLGWESVVYFQPPRKGGVASYFSNIRFLLGVKKIASEGVERFFMGEFNSVLMHKARGLVKPDETFLLDDGTATLEVQRKYLTKNVVKPQRSGGNRIKWYLYPPLRDNLFKSRTINLFTSFAIENIVPGQQVIYNRYCAINKLFAQKKVSSKDVFYFGSKHSEAGITTIEFELEFISKVQSYYASMGIAFYYIPHRGDSARKLELIKSHCNATVFELNMPAELYFIHAREIPAHVGAAFSTVLNNIRFISHFESITSFRIPDEQLKSRKQHIDDIYCYYARSGVDVVELL